MRNLSLIFGFIAIVTYFVWYDHIFKHWPNVEQVYSDITNMIIYLSLSIAFFTIGGNEKDFVNRWFVFYAIAEFWLFLVIVMVYNNFIYNVVLYHKTLVSLLIVLFFNFIVALIFLIKWLHKSS